MKYSVNLFFKFYWKRSADHPAADLLPRLRQSPHVIDVQGIQPRADALAQPALVEEQPERLGCRREPVRHAQPGRRQLAEHLAQGRVLAAHRFDVGHAEL